MAKASSPDINRLENIISSFLNLSNSKLPILSPIPVPFTTDELDILKKFAEEEQSRDIKLNMLHEEMAELDVEINALRQKIAISTRKLDGIINESRGSGISGEPTLTRRMNEEIRLMRIKTHLALCELRTLQRDDY